MPQKCKNALVPNTTNITVYISLKVIHWRNRVVPHYLPMYFSHQTF